MKNVYEVLRQKEMELTRLEKEVEALRLVAPLLSEEKEMNSDMVKPALATAVNGPQQPIRIPAPPSAGGAASARSRVGRYRQALAVNARNGIRLPRSHRFSSSRRRSLSWTAEGVLFSLPSSRSSSSRIRGSSFSRPQKTTFRRGPTPIVSPDKAVSIGPIRLP